MTFSVTGQRLIVFNMEEQNLKGNIVKVKLQRDKINQQLEKATALRPSYLEIDLDAFSDNFNEIKSRISDRTSIMAVVKANAYGHGLVKIAHQAEKCGADMLGVALVEEGEELIESGISIPVVVLYPDAVERAGKLIQSNLIATVDSLEYLQSLNQAALSLGKTVRIFIKAETGMARYGAGQSVLQKLIKLARQMKAVDLIGVSTNLADSNNGDNTFTKSQFDEFKEVSESIDLESDVDYLSIENSSGFLYHHDEKFNLIRIGLLLYGISPQKKIESEFRPVMSLKSRIISLKKWPAGKPVGYSGSFVSKRESLIATIGLGYADGYPWSLSNKGYGLINGFQTPIAGKICMDAMMFDVTDVPDIKIGDEVVLLGQSGDKMITALELAEQAGSFSYETISRFTDRLPRIYKGG